MILWLKALADQCLVQPACIHAGRDQSWLGLAAGIDLSLCLGPVELSSAQRFGFGSLGQASTRVRVIAACGSCKS